MLKKILAILKTFIKYLAASVEVSNINEFIKLFIHQSKSSNFAQNFIFLLLLGAYGEVRKCL